MKNALLFLYTETSLHAGTGSGLSAVDLPIQRERTTQYPIVQGSGVKGAIRNTFPYDVKVEKKAGYIYQQAPELEAIFGPSDKDGASAHAGAISFGEARILLFPVRSLVGVFAYVTCVDVLARFARDAQYANTSGMPEALKSIQNDMASGKALVANNSKVVAGKKVVLEEFSFDAEKHDAVDEIATFLADKAFPEGFAYQYWRDSLAGRLVILPNDDFRDFVVNSTEISTHVRLDPNKKTVETGALWTSESLPSDCLLYSTVTARDVRLPVIERKRQDNGQMKDEIKIPLPDFFKDDKSAARVLEWFRQKAEGTEAPKQLTRIQLGGDETTGQGFVALRWII